MVRLYFDTIALVVVTNINVVAGTTGELKARWQEYATQISDKSVVVASVTVPRINLLTAVTMGACAVVVYLAAQIKDVSAARALCAAHTDPLLKCKVSMDLEAEAVAAMYDACRRDGGNVGA